jgi:hypothetical protein
MLKQKKPESPTGTPIQTPIQTPDRPTTGNSFDALQPDSDAEDEKSVETITADDPNVEIESTNSENSTNQTDLLNETVLPKDDVVVPAAETPEDLKRRPTSNGPIAQILPTDNERLGTSIPLFASQLATTAGKLFPDQESQSKALQQSNIATDRKDEENCVDRRKPPPVAALPTSPLSQVEERVLAADIFGDEDSKPPAKVNPYNSAARSVPNTGLYRQGNFHEDEQNEKIKKAVQKSREKFPHNRDPGLFMVNQKENATNMDVDPETDQVEKLNESISLQQAQLQKLQTALAALKASQSDTGSNMEEDSFILVGPTHKKRSEPAATIPVVTQPSLAVPTSENRPLRDPLTELATKRPVYPTLPEPTPKRQFYNRMSWRIDIPKADTPAQALIEGISEIWTVLKEADEKLIIYPWKARNFSKFKPLSGPAKLQNANKEFINRYFPDAYFRPQPGTMYLNVYVGTSISLEELGLRTQFFFGTKANVKRVGVWKNAIPFEDVVEIGWLFRSTPGMSAENIQKELFAHTGIHASLRWRLIYIGVKGKLTEDLESRALHISVRREDCNLAKAKFTKLIFARHRRSHFIGGSPMRLIPLFKDVSPRNQIKCVHYAGRQQTFLKEIMTAEVFDISQIDIKSVGLRGRTLRELILEIPIRDTPTRQAFLSVDRSFNSANVKLCFYGKYDSECRSRISTLLPYLVFTNPHLEKGIRGCFSADANERAKGVKWDDKRKEVVTVDDEIFESFETLDSDDEADNQKPRVQQFMLNFAAASGLSNKANKPPSGPPTKVIEGDAASLFSQSTMRSKKAESSDESDDTPKTINRSPPTAQTEALSSLSEGASSDLKARLELMMAALLQITTMIPNNPENQAALANLRAILPSSQRAGSSSDSQDLGSDGSGALLR